MVVTPKYTAAQIKAHAYIAAWGGRVRPGIMHEVIRGAVMARGIMNADRYSNDERQAQDEEIEVFKAHYANVTGCVYPARPVHTQTEG